MWDILNKQSAVLTPREDRLWEAIRINPEKWQQHPYGDHCGGFWVVGLIGRRVIWFNNMERGFNISSYRAYGQINEYRGNWDSLDDVMKTLLNYLEHGYGVPSGFGAPQPGEYSGKKS